MREIVKRIVGRGGLFRALRTMRMRWLRLRHGLRHVHPTAYISTLAGAEIGGGAVIVAQGTIDA